MTQDSPQVQEIRARYKASLSDKAQMINEYLTAFQENSNDELLTQIRGELHKLAQRGCTIMMIYPVLLVLAWC